MAVKAPTSPPAKRPAHDGMQAVQVLLRKRLVTDDQVRAAREVQHERFPDRPLIELVAEQAHLSHADLVAAQAAAIGVPFLAVSPRLVNPEALKCLPFTFCEKQNVLPVQVADGWLTVAVERYSDLFLVEEIARQAQKKVQVVAATGENLREVRSVVTAQFSAAEAESGESAPSIDQNTLDDLTILTGKDDEGDETKDLASAAAGSPIINLVNQIIRTAVQAKASDIHIEPGDAEFRVRYRIDGDLISESLKPSMRLLPAVVSRIKILAGMDIAERRLPQDGNITVAVGDRAAELRVSTMTTPAGEKVVLRIMDSSGAVKKLDDQGFAPLVLQQFRAAVREPHGMVLVTGPTGSGKSTTLYAALSEIVSDRVNISTVEDPVERRINGVNQFQINPKAGFTFPRALRSLLRQDPDVVMVGEIRDAETAKLATEAALTGHLVLSTLHTNDAPTAVPRLVNMGVEPYLVAASLRAVVGQRLVSRICSHCKEPAKVVPAAMAALRRLAGDGLRLDTVYRGTGCLKCRNTGFSGRVAVHELLPINEEMLESIGTEINFKHIRELAGRSPIYRPLPLDCLDKVKEGLVAVESVFDLSGYADVVQGDLIAA